MSPSSLKDEKKEVPAETEVEPGVFQVNTTDVFDDDSGVDPVYYAKATLLNQAVQEIGMGRYQVSFSNMIPSRSCLTCCSTSSGICLSLLVLAGSREYEFLWARSHCY